MVLSSMNFIFLLLAPNSPQSLHISKRTDFGNVGKYMVNIARDFVFDTLRESIR